MGGSASALRFRDAMGPALAFAGARVGAVLRARHGNSLRAWPADILSVGHVWHFRISLKSGPAPLGARLDATAEHVRRSKEFVLAAELAAPAHCGHVGSRRFSSL